MYVWFVLFTVLLIIEAVGPRIETIWFVAGSLFALVVSVFGGPVWLQIAVFATVSVAALILTRPLVKKLKSKTDSKLNSDMVIDKNGIVTEAIDNIMGKGQVAVDGKIWSAKSSDDNNIAENTKVTIKEIQGAKLVVEPYDNIRKYRL